MHTRVFRVGAVLRVVIIPDTCERHEIGICPGGVRRVSLVNVFHTCKRLPHFDFAPHYLERTGSDCPGGIKKIGLPQ